MDHFWIALSRDIGRIPETVKNVLELTEYVNAALAYVGNEEIAVIEEDVRRLPEMTNKPANDPSLRKYFGRFVHSPERFRFMAGEKAIIRLIASCIQRKGISHYLKHAERRDRGTNEVVAAGSMETNANDLRRKIVDFYNERCDGSAEQKEFCNRISNLKIDVSEAEDGGLIARIRCVFCPNNNDITCRPERIGGSWKVSNFVAHNRNSHKAMNPPNSATTVGRPSVGQLAGGSQSSHSSTSPPVGLTGRETSSNDFQFDCWSNSNDVTSSHGNVNPFQRKHSSGSTMEDFECVVKEEILEEILYVNE